MFETIPRDIYSKIKPITFGRILCTSKGTVLIGNSMWFSEIDRMQISLTYPNGGSMRDNNGNKQFVGKNSNIFKDMTGSNTGIKLLCEGPDKTIYIVDEKNNFGCMAYKLSAAIMMPPFNFYTANDIKKNITAIWIDEDSDLYAATNTDTLYIIPGASKLVTTNAAGKTIFTYTPSIDKDSNFVVTQGARTIKKISLGPGIIPYSFAQDSDEARILLIGTNNGLYGYDKQTGQSINYFKEAKTGAVTITNLETNKLGSVIWFSTLEKGMARFNTLTKSIRFFEYPKKITGDTVKFPVNTFSRKSVNEFFVAVADSLPAIFNTETGKYTFIADTIFSKTPNRTTDIKADQLGNLYISKGGGFFWSKEWLQKNSPAFKTDSSLYGPFITDIMLDGTMYTPKNVFFERNESLKEINLKYDENKIEIYYSCRGIPSDSLIFAWKMDNYSNDWIVTPYSVLGEGTNMNSFDNLKPGKYIFRAKAKNANHNWLPKQVELVINISPPFWQTWWFWLSAIAALGLLIISIVKLRVNAVRKQERLKAKHEKELLELEARALRSQMNPHFIFNCMNSIKSLIQQQQDDKAVNYLTTFSKLIRTIFQNSDKREITLFDEIETCRLYTQLESMRFGNKFSYSFSIDETIDLKSLLVPALIIQPFIENAIWHGIMPKAEGGYLTITVKKEDENICCIIDDNGIGREMSKQHKFRGDQSTHQSKGVHLTQSRLDLDNLLNARNASIKIIDKKDELGNATGTKIIIKLSKEI